MADAVIDRGKIIGVQQSRSIRLASEAPLRRKSWRKLGSTSFENFDERVRSRAKRVLCLDRVNKCYHDTLSGRSRKLPAE